MVLKDVVCDSPDPKGQICMTTHMEHLREGVWFTEAAGRMETAWGRGSSWRVGSYWLVDTELLLMARFWRGVVVVAAEQHCECI